MRATPKEFLKKTPPMFIIRPRIEWNDQGRFLANTPVVQRMGDLYHTRGWTNLQDFFVDNRTKTAIKFQMNRHVMLFDVVLIFNTLMQQINWSNYFLNAIRQEIPFNIQTCLESYIPREMMEWVSKLSGVPLLDDTGSTKSFLKYMNGHSVFPITQCLQGSTGNEEFFRMYPVNIDSIITNFSTDEGERNNQIVERYQISFTMRCEFYGTGFYYIFSDRVPEFHLIDVNPKDSNLIPIFTDVITKEDIDLPMGWNLYASPSCRLEDENDSVDLSSLLNDSIRECIKFHKERGISMMNFFKLRVRKQGKLLEYGKDYDFDLDKFTVNFHNCNPYYTYKILIMLNIEYINDLIKDIYKLG